MDSKSDRSNSETRNLLSQRSLNRKHHAVPSSEEKYYIIDLDNVNSLL